MMAVRSKSCRWFTMAVAAIALAGCFDSPSSTDPTGSPSPAASYNGRPSISGTPPKSIKAGENYSFTPSASDPDGDALRFSVTNRPAWLAFDASTGRLSGIPAPADVGTYPGIVIEASDGRTSSDLGPFTIEVTQVALGSVTLSWSAPTENTDGSPLTNLAGYRIYLGTSRSSLDQVIRIDTAGITRYVIDNLSPATYYFAMTAFTSAGAESERSAVLSKSVG